MADKNYLKRAQSKDVLRNFGFSKDNPTVFPDFSLPLVLALVKKDPIARGALTHFVDKCMEGDYAVITRDTRKYDDVTELLLDEKFKFRTDVLRKVFLLGKLFNNVYIEVVRDSNGVTKGLNVLDTLNIGPVTLPNGDAQKYVSAMVDPATGKAPEWQASDITWIKFNDTSTGMAPVDLRALYETLKTKEWVVRFVAWLWETGQYRLLYNFDAAVAEQNILDFVAQSRRNDSNFAAPSIAQGKLETKILRDIKETDSISNFLQYLDNQILIAMRVPPIDAGIPDASGRSNADAQSNNLGSHVIGMKKIVEDAISFDLFPKINKGNSLFKFAPNDRFSEKQVFEVVQMMKSMGMTDDVCTEYMLDRGMVWKTEEIFVEPVMAEGQSDNPRSLDNAPSRKGKGTGEANKKQETVTTRPDQLKKE